MQRGEMYSFPPPLNRLRDIPIEPNIATATRKGREKDRSFVEKFLVCFKPARCPSTRPVARNGDGHSTGDKSLRTNGVK